MICSGLITRDEALAKMEQPIYDPEQFRTDLEFVLKKFHLTQEQFDELMQLDIKKHTDYPTYFKRHYKYMKMLGKQIGE